MRKTTRFDATDYLDSEERQAAYIAAALETGDADFVRDALGIVARARGMGEIAKAAGLNRESLYKALGETGNPGIQHGHEGSGSHGHDTVGASGRDRTGSEKETGGLTWPQDVPIGRSQISLAQLNERSREIFRQIVESYLNTGEPLGSRNLSRLITTPLSPASVRNVMADLEQLGLIYAPHTSAGRLPTELGLRFFVDALMQVGDLNEGERRQIESQVAGAGRSVESVLTEASGLLSGLTHAAGVVLTAKSNVRLKNIEFVRLEPERALVVLVGEDGQVENRVVNLPAGLPTSALTEAGNFLNARIRGKTLSEARTEMEQARAAAQAELDQLTQKVIDDGLASWSGGEERQLIVRGQAHLLEDLKVLEDLERVRLLFDDLESRRDVIDLLGRAERAEGVRIFIGSENKLFSMSGSSTIIAPYHDRAGRIVGVIGVIGPTRLNYARVIPMVDYTSKVVSKLLGG